MKWSLCIATLNRQDALMRTLAFAAAQTAPPSQMVIVDASADWEQSRDMAQNLLTPYPDIPLHYVQAEVRSSAGQRNQGLALCTHEIVFMIDDDSFMHRDCAAEILRLYQADGQGDVAAIAATLVADLPADLGADNDLPARKTSGRRNARWQDRLLNTALGRWVNRKILLQNKDELFLKYDEPRHRQVPDALKSETVSAVSFMPGSAMTVRRRIALQEPFDPSLRYYAAFEDLDVAYRYGRHGTILSAPSARLHHYEAQGGRMKRKKLIIFQMFNMIIFLKRHARNPEDFRRRYQRLVWRRMAGEFLKDFLSRRWGFPQFTGALLVYREWRKVWAVPTDELDIWYPEFQRVILEDL